jgi:5-methylcytosine-specific restriction endonuclease McrA
MTQQKEFWKLEHLSHSQLIESLSRVIRIQRRALAELIAHLGEVEERRLHLEAAYGSMFDYCVARLGMSEDEACRRIDLARLARSYPALYPLLASGEITLSVALVLKPILSQANHGELLAAARGKSIREARELVAHHAPRPDAPSVIRKLPERRAVAQRPPTADLPRCASQPSPSRPEASAARLETPPPAPAPAALPVAPPLRHQSRIEPLSPQRYKIQFTADKAVKDQLEQARDLLRHAIPSGDLGAIVARALQLLMADLLRQRFGAGTRCKTASSAGRNGRQSRAAVPAPGGTSAIAETVTAETVTAETTTSRIPRAASRAVLERDGLACTWRDADGKRCGARAWLEIDHRHPRGKGGASKPENLRILCRAHNHLAAEHEYGRAHVQQAIRTRQQRTAGKTHPPAAPPPM